MLIKDLIYELEKTIGLDLQDEWDNSGLQVGNVNEQVKAVMLCVDVTEEVIDQAIKSEANLIIAHHPILFRPTKSIDYDNFISRKLIKAIKNNIAIYACHTPIDVKVEGLNSYVFEKMGFKSEKKLKYTFEENGYGDICEIPARKLWDLALQIKERLDLDHIILYGDEYEEISKIALVTGSGSSFIDECINQEIDLYITADIGHHDAMDALEQGLVLMDLGHYQSEKFFNELMEKIIKSKVSDLKIISEVKSDGYLRKII